MSNKFDPTNYAKHNPILVYSSDWVKSTVEYRSSLLLIKWTSANKLSINSSDLALIEQNITTQLGSIAPKTYQVKVYDKEYIQFLTVFADAPYSLKFKNPDATIRSKISIWEYIPEQTIYSNMPFYPEGGGTDPAAQQALLTATNANAAAIAGLALAVTAQPNAIANAINNDTVNTLPAELFTIDTVPVLVLVKNNLTRGANISNQGNSKVKLWVSDTAIAPTTGYTSSGYLFHMEGKGSYEIPEPFFKSNIWAIGNVAAGQVSVTRSVDI
jgi:hypothetical protein